MSETTDPPGRLSQFQYFDVNPVWVKDLRQAARNWTVTGTLLLMLAVFYFIALGAMIFGETDSGASSYVGPWHDTYSSYISVGLGTWVDFDIEVVANSVYLYFLLIPNIIEAS